MDLMVPMNLMNSFGVWSTRRRGLARGDIETTFETTSGIEMTFGDKSTSVGSGRDRSAMILIGV